MKYINNYNEFNEGVLTNLFGKMFRDLLVGFNDKEFTNQANTAIASIEKSKSIKELPNIITKASKELSADFEEIKNTKGINDFIKKDISMINLLLSTASKKFAMERLSPNKLYKESTNKLLQEVFMVKKTFKKEQEFQAAFKQNLDNNIKNLTTQLAKKSGYSDEEINKFFESQMQKESKLYEGEAPKVQGQKEEQAEEQDKEDPKFDKLQSEVRKLHKSLYEPLVKKIQEEVTKSAKGNIDDFVKTVKSTKNVDSVKKMITKFAQLDKDKLVRVRDAQGLTKYDAPL